MLKKENIKICPKCAYSWQAEKLTPLSCPKCKYRVQYGAWMVGEDKPLFQITNTKGWECKCGVKYILSSEILTENAPEVKENFLNIAKLKDKKNGRED